MSGHRDITRVQYETLINRSRNGEELTEIEQTQLNFYFDLERVVTGESMRVILMCIDHLKKTNQWTPNAKEIILNVLKSSE